MRMFRSAAISGLIVLGIAGCTDTPELAAERERRRSPVSVRGWIWDVEAEAPGVPGTLSVVDPVGADSQRKARIFGRTYISIENVDYASGGMIETGAFVILDAPPRELTMLIQPPVLSDQRIEMKGIPPNADVFLPGIIISAQGLRFAEPEKIRVRIPGETARATGQTAQIGPHTVPIEQVPVGDLIDRREYPEPLAPVRAGAAQAPAPAAPQESPPSGTQ